MTPGSIIEVVAGVALLGVGIIIYRRGDSQGAVLLFGIAALVVIHALGLLEYRPSAAELAR